MQYVTDAAMAHMRLSLQPAYMDTLQRLAYAAGTGAYGYGTATYTPAQSYPCMFIAMPQADVITGTAVVSVDGDLFLPRDAILYPDDRVVITHLHGEALANPQTFAIVAGPIKNSVTIQAHIALVQE